MLIFKSRNKLLVIVTLLLIAIHSLNSVFLSYIIGKIFIAANTRSMEMFLEYLLVGIFGFLIFMLIGVLIAKLRSRAIKLQNTEIKEVMINHVLKNSKYGDDEKKSLSLLTNDLKQLETKGIEAEYRIINLFFTFTFALIASFRLDVWISLAFLVGSVLAVLIAQIFKNKINNDSNNWRIANANYTNKLKGFLLGIETVKTYQVEELIVERATNEALLMEEKLEKMNFSVESTNQVLYVSVMILSFLAPIGFAFYRMLAFGVALDVVIQIIQLSNSLRTPALQSTQVVNEYSTTKPMRDLYLAIKNKEEISNKIPTKNDFKILSIKDGTLKFNDQIIFNNVNLDINKGDKILIVGPSGIGKSSLLRVIQQSIELDQGTYLYNNEEIDKDLSNLFSLIRQQPLIFDESILYNITLGENYNKEEVLKAIEFAELNELINERGLDYIIDNNLSVGELQRIEIARALIRKREIILADEITSALDNNKARLIREKLLASNYTVIEVSHDLSEELKNKYTKVWNLSEI